MSHPDLARVVRDEGWAVVDLLDRHEVSRALAIVEAAGQPDDHGFYASPAMDWGPLAVETDRRLKAVVDGPARRVLPGHRTFMAGITSKGAGSQRVIHFHQDWTYTDERRWRVVFLWCPLVDVDPSNGGLWVVPGSHRWSTALRPSRSVEATEDLQPALAAMAVPVALRAGQAVAFDPATLHGSGPNPTPHRRPALTMAFRPVEAPLVHFHLDDDGALTGYAVDEAFFTAHPYGSRPSGYPPVDPYAPAVMADDLARALRPSATTP